MIGYALKPGSEATLEVGGASYEMYTQGDGIWIKNAAEEDRMIEAMRKSADVTVKGVSAKGTADHGRLFPEGPVPGVGQGRAGLQAVTHCYR